MLRVGKKKQVRVLRLIRSRVSDSGGEIVLRAITLILASSTTHLTESGFLLTSCCAGANLGLLLIVICSYTMGAMTNHAIQGI